ncbi:hypothetical protein [Micromonospora sp. NBC_01796]|nr:hypothetical protein [Micromonospora sp. NBC_01796]WSA87190.1 hypothetical protein OIE47_06135 [Micromonospora sp. NBC_01796]
MQDRPAGRTGSTSGDPPGGLRTARPESRPGIPRSGRAPAERAGTAPTV